MPGDARGVEENCDVGEFVVVFEDVFEVDHCFAAFVSVEVERRVDVVDDVDGFVGNVF